MKIPIDNILSETPPRLNELFLCDTGYHVGGGNSDIINFTCGSDVNNIVDFSPSNSCEENRCNIPSQFNTILPRQYFSFFR